MGQSTEELSREISGTRQDLAQDLSALQDRVSPSAIVERRKAAARGKVQQMRSRVMGTVEGAQHGAGHAAGAVSGTAQQALDTAEEQFEGSPLAAGLVAFGAGVVVSALFPPSQAEQRAARQVVDAAKEHGQPVLDEAKAVGQEMGEELKEHAVEAAQQVKDAATESAEKVKDEGQSAADSVKAEVQDESGEQPGSTSPSGAVPPATQF
jgi:ElaB/YqjD/DUF883 family membrane-anchored ribosome-binding protein